MGFLSDNFISEFLYEALKWVFSWIGEYWLAIIVVTLVIKFVLLPLDLKQRASSQKMQMASAEMENIKKRYANNPEQAQKKVQEFQKANGIKPTAGCLPMILSMVLLFAFYGALRNVTTEQTMSLILRGAVDGAESLELPSWLWVHNVFQPDAGHLPIFPTTAELASFIKMNSNSISPQMLMLMKNEGILSFSNGVMSVNQTVYETLANDVIMARGLYNVNEAGDIIKLNNGWYGLPLIAGGTLFLQQWLTTRSNPASANAQPGGKMMLYFFPIFSAYICATSNACFAMYWTLSNIFAMGVHLLHAAYTKHKKKKEPVTVNDIR